MPNLIARYFKFLPAAGAALAEIAAANLVTGTAAHYLQVGIAATGALVILLGPANAPAPPRALDAAAAETAALSTPSLT